MSDIQELLGELRRVQGVLGTAVLTSDGMCAASDLDERFDENAIAGLVSFLVSTSNRALSEMSSGSRCSRVSMHTTHGKLIVADCDGANLVVITDQFSDLEPITHEVDDALRRLRRVSRIRI